MIKKSPRTVSKDNDTYSNEAPLHFIGRDPKVLAVLDRAMLVADTEATVLITGESGTGKDLIAQILHNNSSRAHAPYIAINCGALTETLCESELFGHVQGAFTGAIARKKGKFEAADGGTIFLDEVSEMPKSIQIKLLRILQCGEYAPVGSAQNIHCNTRVIAATNRNLQALIGSGEFRQDFYYRLKIIELDLPPLRERRGDIPLLIDHFLFIFSRTYDKPGLRINSSVRDLLMRYDFPGNIRELEHILHQATILCRDVCISARHLPPSILTKADCPPAAESVTFHQAKAQVIETFERDYLTSVLFQCGGIVSRAAEQVGLSERIFREKLKKYDICWKQFRKGQASPEDAWNNLS